MTRLTVCWKTRDEAVRARICERFGIPRHVTVNHETRAEIRDEDMPLLRETARMGFVEIRFKKNPI